MINWRIKMSKLKPFIKPFLVKKPVTEDQNRKMPRRSERNQKSSEYNADEALFPGFHSAASSGSTEMDGIIQDIQSMGLTSNGRKLHQESAAMGERRAYRIDYVLVVEFKGRLLEYHIEIPKAKLSCKGSRTIASYITKDHLAEIKERAVS